MSTNFINGWQYPSFKIYHVIGGDTFTVGFIKKIDLPLVNEEGLIESVQELKNVHELLNYSLEDKIYGYRITWTLPYSNYANKNTMLSIQEILQYLKAGYRVVLTPRSDLPMRNFIVKYSGDKLDVGNKKGGSKAVGNRLATISFTTKDLVDDLGWIDPDKIPHAVWYNHNYFCVKV